MKVILVTVIYAGSRNHSEVVSDKYKIDLVYESRLLKELLKNNERSVKKLDKDDYANGEEEVFQINVSSKLTIYV